MKNRVIHNKRWVALHLLLAIVAVGIFLWSSNRDVPEAPFEPREWPAFTATYERNGPVYGLDYEPRFVYRLEYTNAGDWKETMMEGPIITVQNASYTDVGTYQQVQNGTYVMYDAPSGSKDEEPVEDGVTRVPHPAFHPSVEFMTSMEANGGPLPNLVASGARVCIVEQCVENTPGVAYVVGIEVRVFTQEHGIPLRFWDVKMIELTIGG